MVHFLAYLVHTICLGNTFLIDQCQHGRLKSLILQRDQDRMIERTDPVKILTPDKLHAELYTVILLKDLAKHIISSLFQQSLRCFFGSHQPGRHIPGYNTGLDPSSSVILFMVSLCHKKAVEFAEKHLSADTFFVDPWHVFIPHLLIAGARNVNRLMRFPFPMRRYIGPFVPVMPDQIITGPVRDHNLFTLEVHIFYREHHIFVKKKRAASPSHGIAAALLFFIGKHDLLQFL